MFSTDRFDTILSFTKGRQNSYFVRMRKAFNEFYKQENIDLFSMSFSKEQKYLSLDFFYKLN